MTREIFVYFHPDETAPSFQQRESISAVFFLFPGWAMHNDVLNDV